MYELFARFAEHPLLALGPTLVFAALAAWARRKAVTAAAVAWGVYWLYETGVSAGVLCSGDCAIRADLLLIAPLLLALSAWALVTAMIGRKSR